VPLLLWVARGLLKYGSAFGRGVPYRDFFANLNGIYVRIAHWFLPESVTNRIPAIAFGVVVLAVLLLINRKEDWKRLGARLVARENLPMMLFLGLYLIILLITTTNSDHPEIFDDRYLAPVFVIIWILLFLVLDELALPHLRFGAGWKDYLAAAAILLWLLYPANVLRKYAVLSLESGMVTYNEYNNARYHQSEIMRMAQTYDFEEGVSISTNYPDGLYFFTGLDVLDAPREEGFTRFPSEELAPGAIERWQGGPEGYLIWFWPSSFKRYYLPEMLKQFMDVTTIYESRDGGFYYIAEREE
jgi:hypothetical protein